MTRGETILLCGLLCGAVLTACAAPPAQISTAACPPVIVYTPAEEADIYAALMALPPGSVLHKIADEDYHFRLLAKACSGP